MIVDADGDGVVAAAGLITMDSDAVAVVPAVAVSVTGKVPDAVGVPLIVPVSELIVSPAGSPDAAQLTAPVPPLATRVAE